MKNPNIQKAIDELSGMVSINKYLHVCSRFKLSDKETLKVIKGLYSQLEKNIKRWYKTPEQQELEITRRKHIMAQQIRNSELGDFYVKRSANCESFRKAPKLSDEAINNN